MASLDAADAYTNEATDSTSSPHSLTFRVMRLTTPLLPATNTSPFISTPHHISTCPPWQAEGAPCGVGHLNILPSSFGSIYMSETFRSFISVFNRSSDTLRNVSIAIHLHIPSSRRLQLIQPYDSNFRPLLSPRASVNNIVSIPILEQGPHVLVCLAKYQTSLSAPSRVLRQIFSFGVLPPVDASISVLPLHRVVHIPNFSATVPHQLQFVKLGRLHATSSSHYLLHVRIHNAIPVSIFDVNATLTANPPFHVRPIYTAPKESQTKDRNGRRTSVGAGDSRNLVFLMFSYIADSRWKQHSQHNLKKNGQRTQRTIGYVKIGWRSAHGEQGQIHRDVTEAKDNNSVVEDVSVSIYAVPHQVEVHRPFVARCAARNNGNQPIRMYLQIRRDLVNEIVPVGVSGVSLGVIAPKETRYCALTLIGLVRGQHNISGVRVVDMDSNISYKADSALISVN